MDKLIHQFSGKFPDENLHAVEKELRTIFDSPNDLNLLNKAFQIIKPVVVPSSHALDIKRE